MTVSLNTQRDSLATMPSPMKSETMLASLSQLSLQNLLPLYNERAVLAGRTGSGKTTLAERLLRHYGYVAVLDIKGRLDWQGYDRKTKLAEVMKSEHTHIIYAPEWSEMKFDPKRENWSDYIDTFFRWVYERANTVLYVDEVMSITRGDEMPEFYRASLTRGRELGVAVFSSTQRPMRIPQVILSESEHYYIFSLQLAQDRAKVEQLAGQKFPIVRGHEFAYTKVGTEHPPRKFILIP